MTNCVCCYPNGLSQGAGHKLDPTGSWQVPIFRCQNSAVDPKNLLKLDAFSLDRVLKMDPEFLDTEGEHQHDLTVSSCSCKFEGELNVHLLQMWIEDIITEKGVDLFRYKGRGQSAWNNLHMVR